jgi:ferredoxin
MKYGIVLDRELCSGFGACANVAPELFRMERDGRAVAVVSATDHGDVREAVAACPMAAITITEEQAA